jgi:hypothetical protein
MGAKGKRLEIRNKTSSKIRKTRGETRRMSERNNKQENQWREMKDKKRETRYKG